MALLRGLTVLLLSSPAVAEMLRQELLRQHRAGPLKSSEPSKYPEQWYPDQTLDHFIPGETRTFKQRYFANFDHYKPGGPIIINIGGEGPLEDKDVSGYLSNALFAEQLGGGTVALEHRFYGKSQPFDSLAVEHLPYLTSRQALHDLAQFQNWFAKKYPNSTRFFCLGGSYPGSLAAWYRLEFPELTAGCWSSSAPVQAQEVWPGFGEMVWKAVSSDVVGHVDESVPLKLYAGYEQVAGLVHDGTVEAFETLRETFNVCPGTLVSQADRDNFENTVSTMVGSVMQYNNTREPKLSQVRDIVTKASTPLNAALEVSKFLGLTQTPGNPNNCTDNSIGSLYKLLMDSTLPADGSANAMRTWTWQTCNEFGYFQTGTSVFGKPTMYTRGASNPVLWQRVCQEVFGIDAASVSNRIAATNQYYGAKNPAGISHVFFSNGALDAWSLLGVTDYPENDREVYAEVAPLGSHCVGLYSPRDGEVPGATSVRARALALFKAWSGVPLAGRRMGSFNIVV